MIPDPIFAPHPVPPIEAHALAAWPAVQRGELAAYLTRRAYPAGPLALPDPGWWVLTSGGARLLDGEAGRDLVAGDDFGADSLVRTTGRLPSLIATSAVGLAHLSLPRWEELLLEKPALAAALLRATWPIAAVADTNAPTAAVVHLALPDGVAEVPAGTTLAALLPATVAGRPVLAATLDRKVVALDTPVTGDATAAPLTTADGEGRDVLRRSLGLLLLEAADVVSPRLRLQIGASTGRRQAITIEDGQGMTPATLAERLGAEMQAIVNANRPIRREVWTLEEACMRFEGQGWADVASLLRTWQDATVTVVTCGRLRALAMGPFVPKTGQLGEFQLAATETGLQLVTGEGSDTTAPGNTAVSGRWLETLGVRNLGGFNAACVTGQVSQLIRAAEGFHEKRIGQIADRIIARGEDVRAICIAGPSSSGKTTFIKRLTVQLQIDGVNPRAISLDDYYRDRDKTPLSPDGEYDYEALDALDLPLLRAHLAALLAGQTVRTARYDFGTGKSIPDGGPTICLGPNDVLMLEGIHALNPQLLGNVLKRDRIVHVFAWPATTLPIDRLSHFALADLRLLRRIVRDRHTRGADAAANIMRWPSVRKGEERWILPFLPEADEVFDSALVYEPAVLKVYAERYLLEVPRDHPAFATAYRLRQLLERFVAIYPDHVPPTSILREFIGGSGFEY